MFSVGLQEANSPLRFKGLPTQPDHTVGYAAPTSPPLPLTSSPAAVLGGPVRQANAKGKDLPDGPREREPEEDEVLEAMEAV